MGGYLGVYGCVTVIPRLTHASFAPAPTREGAGGEGSGLGGCRKMVGADVMAFQVNFIPVLYAMIEPDLKLIVTCAAARETMVTNYVSIQHDPEMNRDHLTEEASEKDKIRWARNNVTSCPPNLANYRNFEPVTDISFNPIRNENELQLLFRGREDGFETPAALIERTNPENLKGLGYEVILASLKAALECKELDQDAIGDRKRPKNRIAFFLDRALADEIAAHSSFDFDRSQHGDVLLAAREVRA